MEERPEFRVILAGLRRLGLPYICEHPIIVTGHKPGLYTVAGIKVDNVRTVYILIVKGGSSFMDYHFYLHNPDVSSESLTDKQPDLSLEVTKTSAAESRNTYVGQRSTKFAFQNTIFDDPQMVMYYSTKYTKETYSSTHHRRVLSTIGAEIYFNGEEQSHEPFLTLEDLLHSAGNIPPPNNGQPFRIGLHNDAIVISVNLRNGDKISDPAVGITCAHIDACRNLGWDGPIQIKDHNLTKLGPNSKFVRICHHHKATVDGFNIEKPKRVQHWSPAKGEKLVSIHLDVLSENAGVKRIFSNHAESGKSYLITPNGSVAVPKITKIPDLVLYRPYTKQILVLEAEVEKNYQSGVKQISGFDEFVKLLQFYYKDHEIIRAVVTYGYGGQLRPHEIARLSPDGELTVDPPFARWFQKLTTRTSSEAPFAA